MNRSINRMKGLLAMALAVVALTANSAAAQTQGSVSTDLAVNATNEKSVTMSFEDVKSITQGAIRGQISTKLASVSEAEVSEKLASRFDEIMEGQQVSFATEIANASIGGLNLVNVKVHYEPRPVGGILTVRVELLSTFSGIGAANRPVISREIAQAVENVSQDDITTIVTQLSHQLGNQFAEK